MYAKYNLISGFLSSISVRQWKKRSFIHDHIETMHRVEEISDLLMSAVARMIAEPFGVPFPDSSLQCFNSTGNKEEDRRRI